MKINFAAMTDEERTTAFAALDADALAAALTEAKAEAETLFSATTVGKEEADQAEAVVASIRLIETEQASREQVAKEAAERFAAARAQFSDGGDSGEEATDEAEDTEVEASEEATETEEAAEETEVVEVTAEETTSEVTDEAPEAVAASAVNHSTSQKVTVPARTSVAKKVAAKTTRPTVTASQQNVVITASADIPDVPMGSPLESMGAIAAATVGRAGAFPEWNESVAQSLFSQNGNAYAPKLTKAPIASFKVQFAPELKAGLSNDYNAVQASRKAHVDRVKASLEAAKNGTDGTLTAAGWCAPSPFVYNWIADFVVDGLVSVPEVDASRGGLRITQGPQLLQNAYANAGSDLDVFGFDGTEAEAIADNFNKTCETIVCPDFVDHRLDFTGYCWKIPFLTESAYPELIADAMRVADVAYAHKMNGRKIRDMLALSTEVDATPYGGSFTDTLEALTQIAVKERRWWNLGENAVMEVKLPQFARDVFKFDMARRSGLALDDIATDQKIAAHFANHNLSVEYLSDFQDLSGAAPARADWPGHIKSMIYPAGTFAVGVKDVVNLSAVYDAASLAENEYTGVFFEQGYMMLQMGYRSHKVRIPVCTSGTTGANAFECIGGSF